MVRDDRRRTCSSGCGDHPAIDRSGISVPADTYAAQDDADSASANAGTMCSCSPAIRFRKTCWSSECPRSPCRSHRRIPEPTCSCVSARSTPGASRGRSPTGIDDSPPTMRRSRRGPCGSNSRPSPPLRRRVASARAGVVRRPPSASAQPRHGRSGARSLTPARQRTDRACGRDRSCHPHPARRGDGPGSRGSRVTRRSPSRATMTGCPSPVA